MPAVQPATESPAPPGRAHAARSEAPTHSDLAPCEITVVMPCLNEAETIATCIRKARACLEQHDISGEVLIADNGSADGSIQIAEAHGARVVHVPIRGYGAALQAGIRSAAGRFIIMGDADDSYDFTALMPFIDKLRAGYDLVMGNRFKGGIQPGAMPPLHRYLGNPVLSFIGRLFFHSHSGDFHCGLRGFSREAALRLDLQTTGMEFASEMVVKATLAQLRIAEVPTTLSPDGRSRPPHLRSWRDGWRHLRFLLLYSPRWLFLYPGMCLMLLGALLGGSVVVRPLPVAGVVLDIHTLLYAAAMIVVGFQAVTFSAHTKIFAMNEGLLPPDPRLDRIFRIVTLEVGLVVGFTLFILGLAGSALATIGWSRIGFGALDPSRTMRVAISSVLLLILGMQVCLSSFFLSVLGLKRGNVRPDETR